MFQLHLKNIFLNQIFIQKIDHYLLRNLKKRGRVLLKVEFNLFQNLAVESPHQSRLGVAESGRSIPYIFAHSPD